MTENEVENLLHSSFDFCFFMIIVSLILHQKFKIKFFKNIPIYVFFGFFISQVLFGVWLYTIKKNTYGKETKEFLNTITKNTKVYIDSLEVVNPKFIIGKLKKVKPTVIVHGHPKATYTPKGYKILIINQDSNRTINLMQDSVWKWEYRVVSNGELLGITRTIFNNPIKVRVDGKIIEKQF